MIIDTHVHFYDTRRPGTPWPAQTGPQAQLYRPMLPPELQAITAPLGVNGVIEVEASGLLEDNQFILDLADKHPFVFGTCGNLEAGKPGFAKNLERFAKDKRFLGIRCSNLWGRDFAADTKSPAFIADMKLLAQAGLEMDFLGAPQMLTDLLRLCDAVPKLRIVINHLPVRVPADPAARAVYERSLRDLAARPQVYVKVSNLPMRVDGAVPADLEFYRPALDELWALFGSRRLIYGSNWPTSSPTAPYDVGFKIVHAYFTQKGQEAADNYFWRNGKAAYRWQMPKGMTPAAGV